MQDLCARVVRLEANCSSGINPPGASTKKNESLAPPGASNESTMSVNSAVSILLVIFSCCGLFTVAKLLPTGVAFVLCSQVFAWGVKMQLESQNRTPLSPLFSQLKGVAARVPGRIAALRLVTMMSSNLLDAGHQLAQVE
eukprot:s1579_g14.t1